MLKTALRPAQQQSRTKADNRSKSRPKDREIKDDIIPQLVRRIRDHRETWVVHMRQNGKTRKLTLGACGSIPIVRARSMALDVLGSDHAPTQVLSNSTLSAFTDVFMEDCRGRWKASTLKSHKYCLTAQILPALGCLKLKAITRTLVTNWFHKLGASKGARNRALSVLSSIMDHAEIRGVRPPGSNPCKGMRRHDRSFKATYLDAEGYAALGRAFRRLSQSHQTAIQVLKFCALTGCRKSEALTLQWSMIDGKRAVLPDSKTGPRTVWLGKPTRKLLAGIPRTSDLVFTQDGRPIHPQRIDAIWKLVRADLKMPNLRVHDLRHSFASVAVTKGHDLLVVGGLLGHSDKGSTAGYAHLDTPALAAAAARVGKHLEKIVGSPEERISKSKAPKRKPPRKTQLFSEFIHSKDGLTAFCARHDLDPKKFRRSLQHWRAKSRRVPE